MELFLAREGEGDVVRDQGEGRLLLEPGDVLLRPGREVVHPDDFVALAQEAPREMGAEEAGRTR